MIIHDICICMIMYAQCITFGALILEHILLFMLVYADEIIPKYTHVADDVLAQQAGKLGVYAVFAYTIYPLHPLYILIFPSVGTTPKSALLQGIRLVHFGCYEDASRQLTEVSPARSSQFLLL